MSNISLFLQNFKRIIKIDKVKCTCAGNFTACCLPFFLKDSMYSKKYFLNDHLSIHTLNSTNKLFYMLRSSFYLKRERERERERGKIDVTKKIINLT